MANRFTVLRAIRGLHTGDPYSGSEFGPTTAALRRELPELRVDVESGLRARDVRELSRDPEVAGVAPVMSTRLIEPVPVAAPQSASEVAWGVEQVGAARSAFDGSGVVAAVLDTGIEPGHPAFAGLTVAEQDFTGDGNGDAQGHGTHCAGTLCGRNVGGVRIGVARGVSTLLAGKVLAGDGRGESDMLFNGLYWAISNGARVVSMSLGFDFPGFVERLAARGVPTAVATSQALEAYRANLRMFDALMAIVAARAPFDGGTVVVAASGNESRVDEDPAWEIAVSVPAAAQGVVSVGALERLADGRLGVAPYSNRLPEISAPGTDIRSADVRGGLVSLSGTSMATPHVAGIAVLWWQSLASAGNVPPRASNVTARLLASARTDVFGPGADLAGRGAGLAVAP